MNHGGGRAQRDCFAEEFFSIRFGGGLSEDLLFFVTQPTPFMRRLLGLDVHFCRLSYVTELDCGPLDGARAPYDPGGAEAVD